MTTKLDVVNAAKELEGLNAQLQGMAMMNANSGTPEERVERAAQYRILSDRAQKARERYDRAFRQWELTGYPDPVETRVNS